MIYLMIALGGAAGALARFSLGGWVLGLAGGAFPWGTFVVNLSGCLLLGTTLRFLEAVTASPEMRALLTVGFFGAFTTFSTFAYETVLLVQRGEWERAAAYLLGSVLLGVLGLWAGLGLGSALFRAGG